ncbi:MAG: anti-sigma B factor antagonist [Chloroflexi bacterium]|nr:MAG: anti-sigma B factor antagonist [Chloroflexota bacterium]HDH09785.1 anti-sigma factor antagonist [Chloroflexota bacterium]
MKIDITKEDDIVIVAVEGEVDVETSPQLRECFDKLLAEGEHNFVIDMGGVDFIDSSGLAAFVRLFKRVRIGEGDVKLCCIRPEILKIFELTRLNRVFDIFDTRAEAVESFR